MNSLLFAVISLEGLGCELDSSQSTDPDESYSLGRGFSECGQYHGTDVFGFCIYHNSDRILSIEDVDLYCPLAGVWEAECRFNWAAQFVRRERNKIKDVEQLLQGCNGYSDCAFEILDELPNTSIIRQLQLCKTYVQADYADCVSHAIQRWTNGKPTQSEAEAIINLLPQLPRNSSRYYAQAVFCQGLNSCEGSEKSAIQCKTHIEYLKKSAHPCSISGAILPGGQLPY